jgi:hypothetical protein
MRCSNHGSGANVVSEAIIRVREPRVSLYASCGAESRVGRTSMVAAAGLLSGNVDGPGVRGMPSKEAGPSKEMAGAGDGPHLSSVT